MNKQAELISIIMLNYNGLKYLKRTIPPILKLNYPNFEFIVVDNGSTDGSLEFVESLSGIKLIKSPKAREKNFACNYAIEKARGLYILLLDNDCLITNTDLLDELLHMAKTLDNFGSIGLAYFNEGYDKTMEYGAFLSYFFGKNKKNINIEKVKDINGIPIGYAQGTGLFISKLTWQIVGGYDSHLKFGGDDNDLGIKLWLYGYKNYLYSNTLQTHIGTPERRDNKKFSLKFEEIFRAHLYTTVKNFGFINMILILIGQTLYMFFESVKLSIRRMYIRYFFAFFCGFFSFLKDLPYAIEKRREIQSKRIVKEDIFLKINPPSIK
jgi:GT2 family glycosyltransferase